MKRYASIAVLVVIVVVAGGIFLRVGPLGGDTANAAATGLQTATVQLGTLSATVNASGNVESGQAVALSFGQSGIVQEINVQVGDHVKTGQVLAVIDTRDLEYQLHTAQVNLQTAEDKLTEAKIPYTAQDIDDARAAVDAAQASYDNATAGALPTDIAAAQAAVASAQAAYDSAVKSAGAPNSSLATDQATLQKDLAALQQAQVAYNKQSAHADVGMSGAAANLQTATIAYQTALANYEQLATTSGSTSSSQVAAAASTLQQDEATLDNLQTEVTQPVIEAAQATLDTAKNNLAKELAGPVTATVDLAEVTVEQDKVAVQQDELNLQEAEVVAPFDSTVTAINVSVGQSDGTAAVNVTPGQASAVSGSGAIQVANLNDLQIVVNMAETDIVNVKVGQPVEITLDAVPDLALNGKVSQIVPAGTISSGVVSYAVTISLINPPSSVKTGMTADLNVIVQQHSNVLMVPNRAVHTSGRTKTVTVLYEGQQIQVPVQTGLSNDTMTEITSGLRQGDVVVLTASTAASTSNRGPGGPGGMIFRGG
jgi:multidrug efflux pump subunit AcrA (membrane-fusion protein)